MNWILLLLDILHKVLSILVNLDKLDKLDKLNERWSQLSQWMGTLNWSSFWHRAKQFVRGLVITHTLLMVVCLVLAAMTYWERVYSPHMEAQAFLAQCRYIFGGVVVGLAAIYGCFTNNWRLANC